MKYRYRWRSRRPRIELRSQLHGPMNPARPIVQFVSCAALCALATTLSECTGPQSSLGIGGLMPQHVATGSVTFGYTGSRQHFEVPAGVTQIVVTVSGASGAGGHRARGGKGGVVRATLPVSSGEVLALFVGGEGASGSAGSGGAGGFNGGARGGGGLASGRGGDGGGGASDIREGGNALADRIVVAGGGGGGGGFAPYFPGSGGAGGGLVGGSGSTNGSRGGPDGHGGSGGSQSSGGTGGKGAHRYGFPHGRRGKDGSLGKGGAGGGNTQFVGGGGGSSYIEAAATHVKNKQGTAETGNGQIVISW